MAELPVRGLHVYMGGKGDLDAWEGFIREALPREGVNLLVLEVNYDYAYTSYPQVAGRDALSRADVERVTGACREVGVEPVPQINCLGHQSWGGRSGGLLRAFPEFDERPDIPQDAGRDVLYCRSYCPRHPEVHGVVFALIDELADAFGAEQFHVGMDEVFLIAEDECERCAGRDPAVLFAGEVTALRDHLAEEGLRTWMWGDRLINAEEFPTGEWEGSANGTWPAIEEVPKDLVICDWHYERAFETPRFFAGKGFDVVACPWQKVEVALEQLAAMRRLREETDHALGMVQTTWCGFDSFVQAYNGELEGEGRGGKNAVGAAECFRALFAALREEDAL
jgi:hypothetical protein